MKKAKRLKRWKALFFVLVLALALGTMAGCTDQQKNQEAKSDTSPNPITADDEILTYTPVDQSKTTLYVGVVGNIGIQKLINPFLAENPDIQIIKLDITGGNSVRSPFEDWLKEGFRPDVMFITSGLYANINPTLYFDELTTNEVIPLYQAEALNSLAVNGRLYSLPGPSVIYGMYYNKTLFDQYSWRYPASVEEFITLCKQIKADTGGVIQAWNPNAKYELQFIPTLEGFQYTQLFGGVDNRTWYNELLEGKATFTDHLRPFFELYQRLVDEGVITEDDFNYSASARVTEFYDSEIAMINYNISSKQVKNNMESEIVCYPSTEGEGYLLSELSYAVTVPTKTHTEKEADAIQRLLAHCSSMEAQNLFIENAVMISSLKEENEAKKNLPAIVQQAMNTGHIISPLTFKRADQPANYRPLTSIRSQMLSMIKGEQTIDGALAALDAERQTVLDGTYTTELETIAAASEDFTILETSEYFADMYREITGADIALVPNNITYRGNVMRIFAGDLTTAHVTTLIPRSLANKSTLVKASVTGQQLLDTLDNPTFATSALWDGGVYAFSGLKCTVAPWHAMGERMLSIALADGTAIDPAQIYTVAYWDGTVDPAMVTEVTDTYEGTFGELLTAKLKADKTIVPTKDGRMTLVWDTDDAKR